MLVGMITPDPDHRRVRRASGGRLDLWGTVAHHTSAWGDDRAERAALVEHVLRRGNHSGGTSEEESGGDADGPGSPAGLELAAVGGEAGQADDARDAPPCDELRQKCRDGIRTELQAHRDRGPQARRGPCRGEGELQCPQRPGACSTHTEHVEGLVEVFVGAGGARDDDRIPPARRESCEDPCHLVLCATSAAPEIRGEEYHAWCRDGGHQ